MALWCTVVHYGAILLPRRHAAIWSLGSGWLAVWFGMGTSCNTSGVLTSVAFAASSAVPSIQRMNGLICGQVIRSIPIALILSGMATPC